MKRFDVRLVELHGRQHMVAEFRKVTKEEAIRLVRAVRRTDIAPIGWSLIAAQVKTALGWQWVGERAAQAMGVFYKRTEDDYTRMGMEMARERGQL